VQALAGTALFFLAVAVLFPAVGMASEPALLLRADGATLYVDRGAGAEFGQRVTLPGRITAVALSGPGQATVIAAATMAPYALHLFDQNLAPLQNLRLTDRAGKQESPVCAIHVAALRQSFVLVFAAFAELWEVSYNPTAPEIGLGMVHDFQYREGHFVPGYLHPLRSALPFLPAQSALSTDGHAVLLRAPVVAGQALTLQSLELPLDVRKPIGAASENPAHWSDCSGF
jgi:hypothetical protein